MLRFILKRLLYTVFVLLCVSILVFAIIHLAPGNPARLMLPDGATDQMVADMEARLGLDKPLPEQYWKYISGVLRGDLGDSIFYGESCASLIMARLPATLQLTLSAALLSLIIAVPLGIISGVKRGSAVDLAAILFSLLGQSMSPVWLGLLMIIVLAVGLGLLPAFGYGSLAHFLMPSFTLGAPMAALIARMIRSNMIEVLQEDYITATYAKGIKRTTVIGKYAMKNTMIPVVTVVGMQVSSFLGGAVTTEKIFGWPGIGSLTVQAIGLRDFPLVQSILLVVSALTVLMNLLVDIVYTFVDPRLKIQ